MCLDEYDVKMIREEGEDIRSSINKIDLSIKETNNLLERVLNKLMRLESRMGV